MIQLIGLLIWLVVIPAGIGLIPAHFMPVRRRTLGFVMLAGYFGMWAVFEVVTIPAVIFVKYHNFKVASNCFMVLSIVCAMVGLWLLYRDRKEWELTSPVTYVWNMSWAERIEWLLFFALLGFQLYKAAAYASFDGDDAYYVVESLIAQQADVMYRILPYTGRPTDLDVRHVLAVFPMWVAYVAVKSDIHATIVSHLVMPFVLIPLSYLVYYEVGKVLFCRKKESYREDLPIFMIMIAMFQIFGNVSIYTNETFFLTRTWQGKAVAGSLVIPALFWLFLSIYDGAAKRRRTDIGLWIVLVCVNMTAGICSSIAVFLVCILMALTAFGLAIAERDYRVILRMGAACIPNVIYMMIYVVMGYSYLLKG
ncbi:MAG: DUF6077 domain-containing protein [Eubacterium sp.]|nr:DUF6077 domain-containing protein [Eubacterium sp.]